MIPWYKRSHWCLAIVEKNQKIFFYLDPLKNDASLPAKLKKQADLLSLTREKIEYTLQVDSWSCGYFILMVITNFAFFIYLSIAISI